MEFCVIVNVLILIILITDESILLSARFMSVVKLTVEGARLGCLVCNEVVYPADHDFNLLNILDF